jgi:tRNA pseudouridine55 synthase
MLDGILIIDKPADFTSHDVVAKTRRILKTKRVGHTGTLDPFATGVMVILVGRATRLAQFLDKDEKEYEATIRFGFETDTGDVTGRQKAEGKSQKAVSASEIESVLPEFRGEILQTPPMYSAKKIEGKKLYELARKGIEIERKSVKVKIYELEIIQEGEMSEPPAVAGGFAAIENQPRISADDADEENKDQSSKFKDQITIRVVCSAGTYIRTLAEDIGRKMGIGAHLTALRRTRAGKFDLSKAVTLEKLEKIVSENRLDEIFVSMNEAVSHLPEKKLSSEEILKIKNGMKLKFENENFADNQAIRLTDENEDLIAIGFYRKEEKFIQPKTVLL